MWQSAARVAARSGRARRRASHAAAAQALEVRVRGVRSFCAMAHTRGCVLTQRSFDTAALAAFVPQPQPAAAEDSFRAADLTVQLTARARVFVWRHAQRCGARRADRSR
jgi:hypothetical protein